MLRFGGSLSITRCLILLLNNVTEVTVFKGLQRYVFVFACAGVMAYTSKQLSG